MIPTEIRKKIEYLYGLFLSYLIVSERIRIIDAIIDTYNFNLTQKLQFKSKRHLYEKIISLILFKIICSINRDQIFEQSLAMRFGTNYVIRASRNR